MSSPEQTAVVIKGISSRIAKGPSISLRQLYELGEALYSHIAADIDPLMKGSKAVLMYAPPEEPAFPFLKRGDLELYHKAQQQQGQPDVLVIHYNGREKPVPQDLWEISQRVSAGGRRRTFKMRWDVGGVIPVDNVTESSRKSPTATMVARALLDAYTFTIEELTAAF